MAKIHTTMTSSSAGPVCVAGFADPKLTDADDVATAGRRLQRLLDQKMQRRIVLNFENVNAVSSAMIGEILRLHNKLAVVPGGKLVLCNAGERLKQLLKMTKLDLVLPISDNLNDALKQF